MLIFRSDFSVVVLTIIVLQFWVVVFRLSIKMFWEKKLKLLIFRGKTLFFFSDVILPRLFLLCKSYVLKEHIFNIWFLFIYFIGQKLQRFENVEHLALQNFSNSFYMQNQSFHRYWLDIFYEVHHFVMIFCTFQIFHEAKAPLKTLISKRWHNFPFKTLLIKLLVVESYSHKLLFFNWQYLGSCLLYFHYLLF